MSAATAPVLRRWRRFLAGPRLSTRDPLFPEQARRYTIAQTLVRAFYAFLLYLCAAQFSEFSRLLLRRVDAPLWPVAWLAWMPGGNGLRALLAFYAAVSLLGIVFARFRLVRLLVFLGTLEFAALQSSYGKINHNLHLLVLVSGVFVLLPDGWTRPVPRAPRRLRQQVLLVCWLAQAATLLTYTMSGLSKLGGAAYQLARGEPNVFLPGAFGAHIAQRLVQTSSRSTLGDWIIHHPFLTWPLLPGAVGIETLAFLAAFRPALSRPTAALLILFHVGTYFTMTIAFPQSCLLLALFFYASPFEPVNPCWQNALFALPLPGKIRWFRQSRKVSLVDLP